MTTRPRPAPARPLPRIFLAGTAAALIAAAPALGADGPDARRTLASAAAAAEAGPQAPQGPRAPLPRASGRRALDAVTATGLFADAIGDSALAPDLQRMMAFTSDDGRYTVAISLGTNALVPGDFVATFVNTDGNPATGSPVVGGADVAVGILGMVGTDVVAASRWNGVDFQATTMPSLVSFPSGLTDEVWSASAAELGIAPGTATTLTFGTVYSGVLDDYFDFAPEPGLPPFGFTAGALAPPPPPPPPPSTPTVGTTSGGATTVGGRPARPLVLRAFRLRPVPRGVRVTLSWARGEGRVAWRVRLRARVGGRWATRTVRGTGRPGTRTVARTVRLPARWAGARVTARATLADDARSLARTRSLRLRAPSR